MTGDLAALADPGICKKKATSEDPSQRYGNVDEMMRALNRRQSVTRYLMTLVAALILMVVGIGVYFELMPQTHEVEFVEAPAPEEEEDILDQGIDPTTELGLEQVDSTGQPLTEERQRQMEEYEAKAEQIFRKQYAEEAERILSRIYDNKNMSKSEKNFMAGNQEVTRELVKLQMELGEKANLSSSKSQLIASQIIESITNRKKKELEPSMGYQK